MIDDDANGEDGVESLVPNVSEDRPLDALMPEMRGFEGDELPPGVSAVHPTVLEVGLEEGAEWTLACWRDPGPLDLRDQLGTLVEGTILRELSRLPEWEREEEDRDFVGLRVLAFDDIGPDSKTVLEELGFHEEPYEADHYSERLQAWQKEADEAGFESVHHPHSIWALPIARSSGTRGETLQEIERSMLDRLDSQVWGETPGGMAKLLARQVEEAFGVEIELGPEGVETFESILTPDVYEHVRWMAPVCFQGFCDFLGVVAHGHYGVRVQWGMCEPDERGLVPPPMFRWETSEGDAQTWDVGRSVLQWKVAPIDGDDEDVSVAERLEARFG
jgi:hypothetical protein